MCRFQEFNTMKNMQDWHNRRLDGALEGAASTLRDTSLAHSALPADAAPGLSDFTDAAQAAPGWQTAADQADR